MSKVFFYVLIFLLPFSNTQAEAAAAADRRAPPPLCTRPSAYFHAHLNQVLHIAVQMHPIGVAPFAVILIQKAVLFPADAVIRKRHTAALANQLSRRTEQCVDGHIEQLG